MVLKALSVSSLTFSTMNSDMTHEQAMRILDRVREGWLYPSRIVDMALKMTGDLKDD